MSYALTGTTSIQSVSSTQDFQTLLKYSLTGLNVDVSTIITMTLTANEVKTVTLPSIAKLQLIAVKATQPVDLSLKATLGNPTFTLFPSNFHLIIRPDGFIIDHIKLGAGTAATQAEVAVAGLFT